MQRTPPFVIRPLPRLDQQHLTQLCDLLVDCVAGGASIGFMDPFDSAAATKFWEGVAEGVAMGRRAILVAQDAAGICGSVQLVFDLPANQPHRADLVKLLVHSRVRRQGIGASLMREAETLARRHGRTLLVLDAVTDGPAARLYQQLGWVKVGEIPKYALYPDGRPCGTTYFYRDLDR